MKLAPRVPRFRWMLPVVQLFLCAVVLWPLRPMLAGQIQWPLQSYGILKIASVGNPQESHRLDLDLSIPIVQRQIKIAEAREGPLQPSILPGGLPDLVYTIVNPAHAG